MQSVSGVQRHAPAQSSAVQEVRAPAHAPVSEAPAQARTAAQPALAPSAHRKPFVPAARELSAAEVEKDSDPMTHIEYLASDAMRGRNSPSPELDKAAAHIAAYAEKYGLVGPNAKDSKSPYMQTFSYYGYPTYPGMAPVEPPQGPTGRIGPSLYEYGFFLDSTTTQEDLDVINKRMAELRPEGMPLRKPLQLAGNAAMRARQIAKLSQELPLQGQIQNVMGLLPGDGPHKDEVIVVMAHYDHIGARYDRINNGADDNASGSAATMSALPALAELKKQGKLDRSVLFLWTAAEEKGLIGAEYFAKHPIPKLGLKEIAGVINVDMIGRFDAEQISYIDTDGGDEPNYFHGLHEEANKALENPFDYENHDVDEYSAYQDGHVFARRGESVLMVFEGLSRKTGGGYMNPDYHTPRDTVDALLKDNGGEKPRHVAKLIASLVEKAANRPATAER